MAPHRPKQHPQQEPEGPSRASILGKLVRESSFWKILAAARLTSARRSLLLVPALFLAGLSVSIGMGCARQYLTDPVVLATFATLPVGFLALAWYVRAIPKTLLAFQRLFAIRSNDFEEAFRESWLHRAPLWVPSLAAALLAATAVSLLILWIISPAPGTWLQKWQMRDTAGLFRAFLAVLGAVEGALLGVGGIGYICTMALVGQLGGASLAISDKASHAIISAFYSTLTAIGLYALAFGSFLDFYTGSPVRGFSLPFITAWLACYGLVQLRFRSFARRTKRRLLESLALSLEEDAKRAHQGGTAETMLDRIRRENTIAAYTDRIMCYPEWLMNPSAAIRVGAALLASLLPTILHSLFPTLRWLSP